MAFFFWSLLDFDKEFLMSDTTLTICSSSGLKAQHTLAVIRGCFIITQEFLNLLNALRFDTTSIYLGDAKWTVRPTQAQSIIDYVTAQGSTDIKKAYFFAAFEAALHSV